ncbi:hypothetical protein [Inmirania thermothiophila]|uniref:HEAT repeat protein n=1 Tax=Inmirania thermothiophila TaxID=1750597 RepID=A0A3N1Y6K4_9GAMM|nr:hypothetical protein [Inmirania thermothiophila]ROR34434.1 hypothetical protein EDC57_0332 [Inmirania thermothiophila]
MRPARLGGLVLLILAGAARGAADPVAALASAQEPGAVRETALRLGGALERGCCFGRESEIAGLAAQRLAACPGDGAVVAALTAALAPVAEAVAIEEPALARRVFLELPLACLARRPEAWADYAPLPLELGPALLFHDPEAFAQALGRLLALARGGPGRAAAVLERLSALPAASPLPPLAPADLEALVQAAGNDLYRLPELFSRLPGRAGTQALLYLAERRNLSVPPELARWADAGAIRADALRALAGRDLDPQARGRLERLAADPDARVAAAARDLLRQAPGTGGEAPATDPRRSLQALAGGDRAARAEAARALARYLLARPADRQVRAALRRAAEHDPELWVRAQAWQGLLASRDEVFTWQRLLSRLRAGPGREEVLALLAAFETPVPSALVEGLPEALPGTLLALAAGTAAPRLRIEALRTARRAGEWAQDLLSRAYLPEEAARAAADRARARAFLERFGAATEPRVRTLLADPDAALRGEAAAWFVAIPAREPATAEALLAATEDPDPRVRGQAAMALAAVGAVPAGFGARLEARLGRGDADPDLAGALRRASAAALCADPAARPRLAAVVLHRAGDRALRQALAARCRLEAGAARALLEAAGEGLVRELTREEAPAADGGRLADALRRAEEDPPPWSLVARMTPAPVRDAWLLARARDPALDWRARWGLLRRLEGGGEPGVAEALQALLVAGVRADAVGPAEFLDIFGRLGYGAVRALAEAFADDPQALARAARLLERAADLASRRAAAGGGGGAGPPRPGAGDLPWIARQLQGAQAEPRRLGPLVRLLRLYALGQDPGLQRRAWEEGITPRLLEAMGRPGGCEAVRPALHSLLGRMVPPRCR